MTTQTNAPLISAIRPTLEVMLETWEQEPAELNKMLGFNVMRATPEEWLRRIAGLRERAAQARQREAATHTPRHTNGDRVRAAALRRRYVAALRRAEAIYAAATAAEAAGAQ